MYERDEFLRDRIRPHQPGTPRGYSPRPPSGDRCPAPPPGRHAAAATPPGPPRLPSAPLRPLPDPAWPRQPEAPPPSTWADPALAPIRSRTRPGERGWRRMVRLVTFGLVGLGRSGMQRQEAQFEAPIVESWRAQRGAQCGQREKSCRCSRAVHIQGISPPLFRRPLEPAVQAAVASCRLGRHPVVAHRVTVALGQGSQLAQRECPRPA